MKLLKIVRRDAEMFWECHCSGETWTQSMRGHYISGLQYPRNHNDFFHDFMYCEKDKFQRKLYHDYWKYKKAEYYKRFRKKGKRK